MEGRGTGLHLPMRRDKGEGYRWGHLWKTETTTEHTGQHSHFIDKKIEFIDKIGTSKIGNFLILTLNISNNSFES